IGPNEQSSELSNLFTDRGLPLRPRFSSPSATSSTIDAFGVLEGHGACGSDRREKREPASHDLVGTERDVGSGALPGSGTSTSKRLWTSRQGPPSGRACCGNQRSIFSCVPRSEEHTSEL